MAKKKPSLSSAVVAFMSDDTQASIDTPADQTLLLPLDTILPDPNQPRQLLPKELTEAVVTGSLSRIEAVQAWVRSAESEEATHALRHNIRELIRLAESIQQHGLISPITVREPRADESVSPTVDYLIVTGERRYWAQVYLLGEGRQIQEGDKTTSPDQIKAIVSASGITVKAHQLIENLLREDLNAVEKANGMWALRYELSGVNYSSPFVIGDETEQVNYSSPGLVPWSRVEETLGISKRYRIYVTSVLNLSPEAQDLVRAHSLAEITIRPIVQKLRNKPELQQKALRQLAAWQMENEADEGPTRGIVNSVKDLVDKLLKGEQIDTSKSTKTRAVSSAPAIRFHKKVRQTLDFLSRLKESDRDELTKTLSQTDFTDVIIDLRNLNQQIEDMLNTILKTNPPAKDMIPPDVE